MSTDTAGAVSLQAQTNNYECRGRCPHRPAQHGEILTGGCGHPPLRDVCKGDRKMKATGIVRRVDDLGRIVIPKEIRRTLRIREGDPSHTTLTVQEQFCFAMMRFHERVYAKKP